MFEAFFDWVIGSAVQSLDKSMDGIADGALRSVGKSLSGVNISGTSDPFIGGEHVFMSKTKTTDVINKFTKICEEELAKLPNEFQDYRDPSIEVIHKILDLLHKYDLCFDKFIHQKKILIFSKNIGYTEVWNTRKKMKEILLKIQKLLASYDPKKYSYDYLIKKLIPQLKDMDVNSPELVDQLADKIRDKADEYIAKLPRYERDPDTVDEGQLNTKQRAKFLEMKVLSSYKPGVNDHATRQKNRETKAKEILAKIADGAIKVGNTAVEPPMVGDILLKFGESVATTLEQLDRVIFLGDKADVLAGDCPKQGKSIGVDMKELLGSNYENLIRDALGKSSKNRFLKLIGKGNIALFDDKAIVDKSINKFNEDLIDDMIRSAKKTGKHVERAWDKIQIAKKEAEKLKINVPLVVIMPSNSEDEGGKNEKEINIDERYEKLKKIYIKYLKSPQDIQQGALYIRKGEKFLLACELWIRNLKERLKVAKKETVREEKKAKEWIDRAKKYYKKLDKSAKITKKQAYDEIPKKTRDFVLKWADSVKKVSEFMYEENDN